MWRAYTGCRSFVCFHVALVLPFFFFYERGNAKHGNGCTKRAPGERRGVWGKLDSVNWSTNKPITDARTRRASCPMPDSIARARPPRPFGAFRLLLCRILHQPTHNDVRSMSEPTALMSCTPPRTKNTHRGSRFSASVQEGEDRSATRRRRSEAPWASRRSSSESSVMMMMEGSCACAP